MGDADYCTDDDNNNTAHGRNDAMFMNNVWDTAAENVNHLERENDICFKKEAAGIVGLLTPEKMVKAGEFVVCLDISIPCLHLVSLLQSHSFPILHIMFNSQQVSWHPMETIPKMMKHPTLAEIHPQALHLSTIPHPT